MAKGNDDASGTPGWWTKATNVLVSYLHNHFFPGDVHAALDTAQETVLGVFEKYRPIDAFYHHPNPIGLLVTSATYLARTKLRKDKRHPLMQLVDEELVEDARSLWRSSALELIDQLFEDEPLTPAQRKGLIDRSRLLLGPEVRELVDRLSEDEQLALLLYYVYELKDEEVGQVMFGDTITRAEARVSEPFSTRDSSAGTDGARTFAAVFTSCIALAGHLGRTIRKIEVRVIELTHTRIGDLSIELIAPGGRTVTLFTRPADRGTEFRDTTFTDTTYLPIFADVAPYSNRIRPSGKLADLRGGPVDGTYTLRISDHGLNNSARLGAWGISVYSREAAKNGGQNARRIRYRAIKHIRSLF